MAEMSTETAHYINVNDKALKWNKARAAAELFFAVKGIEQSCVYGSIVTTEGQRFCF